MTTLLGGCHCENLRVELETSVDPRALPLRACQCSFCVRHGAISTADPAGRLRIEVAHSERLHRYRFGLKITDFLLCRECGVYVAATMQAAGGLLGVLNANVLEERGPFDRPAEPMRYGAETVEAREARRAKGWMPAEVRM